MRKSPPRAFALATDARFLQMREAWVIVSRETLVGLDTLAALASVES